MPVSKIGAYIEQRAAGLEPISAAIAAGYAQSGIQVTSSRLEQREDVRQALRKANRVGKSVKPLRSPTSKRQYRSVADEPESDDPILEPWKLKDKYASPLDLLIDVMNNAKAPGGLRIQCAKDAMPYCHARKETSKKEDNKDKAKRVGNESSFRPMPVPLRKVA
jgi:hypothetical protein